MGTYLRLRNNYYYLRLRVPEDLRNIFPKAEILKSLKTTDRKLARISASTILPSILEVFTLTRAGFISQEQAIERLECVLKRQQGLKKVKVPPEVIRPTSPSIPSVILQYISDNESGWSGKTKLEYGSYFRLLQDVLGSKVLSVEQITRDEVRRVRDTLVKLPANLYKKYPGKTISEILALGSITPMSTTTVNKLLMLFGCIMRHCVKEGYITKNPVEGLKIQQRRRPDEERKAYSQDDLKRLIAALPSPADKRDKHWIPLIAMYSGMRMGEICGLHLADIRQVQGVWCFDVNEEEDKRLKNVASKRLVPIHPTLKDKGLLQVVEEMRAKGNKRMWPNLTRREIDGYCHSFGNWFGRFNRKHITEDPLKSFHSLRHSFANTLKQKGVSKSVVAELMGHSEGSMTFGRYGKAFRPEVLLEALVMVDY